MPPSEQGDMFDHFRWRSNVLTVEVGASMLEIKRVPVDDGVDQQVEPERPVELALEGFVPQFTEPVEAECSGQGALSFAFVEIGCSVPAHFGVYRDHH